MEIPCFVEMFLKFSEKEISFLGDKISHKSYLGLQVVFLLTLRKFDEFLSNKLLNNGRLNYITF